MSHRGAGTGTFASTVVRALILAFMVVPLVALPGPGAGDAHAAVRKSPDSTRTVIIGVPGLMWSDISERDTPALWRLTGQGAAASLSVRTQIINTCPMDGWLTVSAGQRSHLDSKSCALPAAPQVAADGSATAQGWAQIRKFNADSKYHSVVGLLGRTAKQEGQGTLAVGPGAAYGLADENGRVDRYAESPDKVASGDWAKYPLAAVDVDDIYAAVQKAGVDPKGKPVPVPDKARAAAAAAADRKVAQVLAARDQSATVLLAGLADTDVDPHLRVALATGSAYPAGYMSSSATRQTGLVTLTDVTATAMKINRLAQPEDAVGSPWEAVPSDATAAQKQEDLANGDEAAQAIRGIQGSFFWTLGCLQVAVYLVAALLLWKRWGPRGRVLAATRAVALTAGAAPVGAFLAGLIPWWKASSPTPVLVALTAGFAVLVAGVALAGPWRRTVLVPGLVVAGVTMVVLAVDVMTGSRLQMNSFMGYTALVAGRFYGFGNQAFSLFAAASVLTAAWLADRPVRAGRSLVAAGTVAVVGVLAVAVDGLPMWGSDFGGVLAMVPVFALVGLMVSGRRVSWWKLGLFGVAGAVVVLFISFLNARSAHPTHLGRFWQQLENGDAWGVVVRKFNAMIGALGLLPVVAVLAVAVVVVYLVLVDPGRGWVRGRAGWLERLYAAAPTMRPALLGALSVGVIGTLVNDSGIIILSVAFILTAPLTLAAVLRTLEERDAPEDTSGPGTPAPRSAARGR